jgi:very-short-patch-repair endonuclease
MAAVLASGPGAVLSHRAAAALWGIRGGSRIEVTVPRGGRMSRHKIHLHWANLPADETTTHHGIPTTTVPRTLLDLSAVVQPHELRSGLRQAEQLGLTDRLWLGDLLERYPRRPGTPVIRALVEEARQGLTLVRSELEERFQAFLLEAGIPLPTTNVRIEGFEVDCAWRAERLIVELDGRAVHDGVDAFEEDRARDRRLARAGWRVVRVTWRHLHDSSSELEVDLRKLLGLD